MASVIYGRVGGMIGGYSVSCITTPTSVSGRVGGAVIGGDLNLDIEPPPGRISGRVGGAIIGRSVEAQFADSSGNTVHGRMGGVIDGVDITLSRTHHIPGRCGGPVIGFDVDLQVEQGQMTGRLGGEVVGHSVSFGVAEDVPKVVTALVAVITYQYYRIAQRNSSSSSSGGRRH